MIRKTFILLLLCDVGFCNEEPQWVSFHAAMIPARGGMRAALNQSELADCAASGCCPVSNIQQPNWCIYHQSSTCPLHRGGLVQWHCLALENSEN